MNSILNRAVAIEPDQQNCDFNSWPTYNQQQSRQSDSLDHFVIKDGMEFAGTHLILDFWDASYLNDINRMETALKESILAAKATLLHIHLHHFTPYEGISGVAVLAESHISVHTWPERNYAAFDVFMCGDADPEKTIPILEKAFKPGEVKITKHLRGVVEK